MASNDALLPLVTNRGGLLSGYPFPRKNPDPVDKNSRDTPKIKNPENGIFYSGFFFWVFFSGFSISDPALRDFELDTFSGFFRGFHIPIPIIPGFSSPNPDPRDLGFRKNPIPKPTLLKNAYNTIGNFNTKNIGRTASVFCYFKIIA